MSLTSREFMCYMLGLIQQTDKKEYMEQVKITADVLCIKREDVLKMIDDIIESGKNMAGTLKKIRERLDDGKMG